jgi:hypothetical protein
MEEREGGVIALYSGYEIFGNLISQVKRDRHWRVKLGEVGKHKSTWINRVTNIYVRYISIELPRYVGDEWKDGKRIKVRPPRKKWVVINMQEWGGADASEILPDMCSLLDMMEARGVSIRPTMGSTASAMVRKSSEWPRDRKAATWEMEPVARRYLPNGHHALRRDTWSREKALYIDQKSSHLAVAATEPIPAQENLRFRGFTRKAESGLRRKWWISPDEISDEFTGLYYATIQCEPLPGDREHLYPWWAQEPGVQDVALWSPEISLLDDYVKLKYVSGGLLSREPDWAIFEYANWALRHIANSPDKIRKRVLLAGIGMLGVNTSLSFDQIVTGEYDKVPEWSQEVKMPLFGDGYRSSVSKKWHPSIQNPIALGVIQAHTKVRTLQLARRLESEGVPAVQLVVDAVIAGLHRPRSMARDGSLFIPDGWKCDTLEHWRTYGVPNQVLCDNHPRTPGIPRSMRAGYVEDRPPVARTTTRTSVRSGLDKLPVT